MNKQNLLALLLTFLFFGSLSAQNSKEQAELTIEKIMQDPIEWVGSLPDDIYWGQDNKTIYFKWNPKGKPVKPLYKIIPGESTKPIKVSHEEKTKLPPESAKKNKAESKMTYSENGKLLLYHIKDKTTKVLLHTDQNIHSPNFTHSDKGITFMMDGSFFELNLANKSLKQLVNFKAEKEPNGKSEKSDKEQWLQDQQMEMFEVIKRRHKNKVYRDSLEKEELERPKTIFTNGAYARNIKLSPCERYITYNLYKRGNSKNTKVPHYVDQSGYLNIENARSKVGGNQGNYTMHIYDKREDTVYSVMTENIPGITERGKYLEEYQNKVNNDQPRETHVYGPHWSDDGRKAFVTIRSEDNKDRWIALLDISSGKPEILNRQRDEAWIAGPGIGRSGWGEQTGWLPDNKHIWYQSEASGYSHLYIQNIKTKEIKALTKGKFEVYNPKISNDNQNWYFTANKVHSGERHFYKMSLMGGKMERLTFREGRNDVTLSPDERYMAIRYSYANEPWELYFKKNTPEEESQKLTNSLTEDFQEYDWKEPQFITFQAEDGASVPARLYKPETTEKSNGAAVIFVHGAGYKQNAHKWWSSYFREYMFHNLLVDQGYTVLDIDYRGSAGYGQSWRTSIYRHMGGKDLSDHIDGGEYLIDKHNISADKIGIYGGSYGGFITLMGLFKHPGFFGAGAALRAVTDWAHYNHGYTSNILNTPTTDSLAYRRSSPIYFAEGLSDPLLICHGMVDDNVQFQDVVRLTQRLIELGKENWELAVYPVERHSFREPESWTDEYKRIYKLFEENLRDKH
ncbi:MAG: prolyl oligopeptidase family serine peptidase [Bacteroidales bacterium]